MDDLRQLHVFAAVVQHGSMSTAARALKLTPSAVSQQIKALEQRAGVKLLLRTTRSLTLTDAGARVYSACVAMVAAADRARAEMVSARVDPIGELRISAPVGFARHLQVALCDLIAANPSLSLFMLLDDDRRDLVAERIDLGIAFGSVPDSQWSTRRLGRFAFWLCAAPAYLTKHPMPVTPQDLLAHRWIALGNDSRTRTVSLSGPEGETASIAVTPRIAANNQQTVEAACTSGLGIAALASFDVHEAVASGKLIRVLPQLTERELDIRVLTPQRDTQPAKVRLALGAIQSYLDTAAGVLT